MYAQQDHFVSVILHTSSSFVCKIGQVVNIVVLLQVGSNDMFIMISYEYNNIFQSRLTSGRVKEFCSHVISSY